MRVLDRSLPYGEIFGSTGDARYVQNGILFDPNGREVGVEGGKMRVRTPRAELEARLEAEQDE